MDRHSDAHDYGDAHADRDVDADAHADQYCYPYPHLDANGYCHKYSSASDRYQETPTSEADGDSDALPVFPLWADSKRTRWRAA